MALCSLVGGPLMTLMGSFGLAASADSSIYRDLVRAFDWESPTEAGIQGAVFVVIGLSRLFTLIAAFCVYKQRARPFALFGTGLMCVPCFTSCAFMDVGVGLFALFTMLNEHSRNAFLERP